MAAWPAHWLALVSRLLWLIVSPPELLAPNFDGRATAVAQGPKKMLEQIGVWQALGTEVALIRDIRVADGQSNLFLHYDHADVERMLWAT